MRSWTKGRDHGEHGRTRISAQFVAILDEFEQRLVANRAFESRQPDVVESILQVSFGGKIHIDADTE